ncbi:MAG TPA: bifunctional riboflavin kinase/FAD synthetase [Bacillaceae bacterium]
MIHHPHTYKQNDFPPMAMALGFFDGVHQGHQKVIGKAVETAREHGLKSAVMTFDPHPSVVLGQKNKQIRYITPLQDKIRRIEDLGVDYLFIVRFTSAFASLAPEEFVEDYLTGLNVRNAIAGFDYTYGKFGKGTMETMPEHAKGAFIVTTVNKLEDSGEKISSTAIRSLLAEGETEEAMKQLGRFYSVKGTVVHGEKRGRTIGFPTANIRIEEDYIIPKTGVYAVRILIGGKWENGVCNIGYKPTFKNPDEKELSTEVHIFDFSRSIYGEEVELEWHMRIRDEQKFSGIDELKQQISKDKEAAIQYFQSSRK